MVVISALILMLTAKIFKLNDLTFKTPIKITLILYSISLAIGFIGMAFPVASAILSILPLVMMVALGIYLIRRFYNLGYEKAILVWLVWFILSIVTGFILKFILGLIFPGTMTAATI